ncbi:MAG: helix-turn-helix domain-containing protein [Candidatus Methylomirabilales bacterium]
MGQSSWEELFTARAQPEGVTIDYYTSSEVARLLLVTRKSVSRYALLGRLPYHLTPGGHRRYPKGEIDRIVMENKRTSSRGS